NKLLDESKAVIGTDSAKAINLALQAKKLASDIGYPRGEAYALKNVGMVFYVRGLYVQTLDYWNQSLEVFEKIKDDVGIATIVGNIGAVYFNQGADDKALEYTLKALQLAEKLGDTVRMISGSINVGAIYHNKKDPVALNYLLKAIPLVESSNNKDALIVITGNIGEIYFDNNDNQKAVEWFKRSIEASGTSPEASFSYNGIGKVNLREGKFETALQNHNTALQISEKAGDNFQVVRSLRGIADVYEKQGNTALALQYYSKARLTAEQMDDVKVELKDLYKDMSAAYAKSNDFRNAFALKSLYSDIKDTLYNLETRKKLNQLQFDFELSKKEGEIVLQEAKIKSEKQIRIGVTIGLGLILIIAFIIYRNYLQKARVNRILDKQNAQIEHLLL
ncbi:MAG: tetratricopeptide repeat protein, partial [Proteobacteria bacterium]